MDWPWNRKEQRKTIKQMMVVSHDQKDRAMFRNVRESLDFQLETSGCECAGAKAHCLVCGARKNVFERHGKFVRR
jgi:hypothetical protein